MATLDRTRSNTPSFVEEAEHSGASLLNELFGVRNMPENSWHQQGDWLRAVVSQPESDVIVRHDEVTIDQIRRLRGRVKIAVTDEGAERVAALLRGEVPAPN